MPLLITLLVNVNLGDLIEDFHSRIVIHLCAIGPINYLLIFLFAIAVGIWFFCWGRHVIYHVCVIVYRFAMIIFVIVTILDLCVFDVLVSAVGVLFFV